MIKNPIKILESGALRQDECPQQNIQPNGIDFNLHRVFQLVPYSDKVPFISETEKQFFDLEEVFPDVHGWFTLEHGVVYDCSAEQFCHIQEGSASILIVRSSLNRLGVALNAGLYDDSFKGNIGFTLQSRAGTIKIKKGTRVGQIVTWFADSNGQYEGQYVSTDNKHWSETYRG